VTCWSCQGDAAPGTVSCGACGALQPLDPCEDHYALFALPRQFALEAGALEQRFRDLSRRLHPDRFARAEPRQRRLALERATRLNDAHRVLKDWRRRAAYLLTLAGHQALAEGRGLHDPAFLEEQLEWREALALARADGDAPALAALAARSRARLAELEDGCRRGFEAADWSRESAGEIARCLARARYYDHLVADAERGAGGSLPPRQET
jgi:molecular chaperone HscB